jgi:uncharacterized protein YbjT (DUF2867 family)
MGAGLDPTPIMGRWFADRENILNAAGLDLTFLRPSTLMTNTRQPTPAWPGARPSRLPGRAGRIDEQDPLRHRHLAVFDEAWGR